MSNAVALWRVSLAGEARLARGPVAEGPKELLPAALDIDGLLSAEQFDVPIRGSAALPPRGWRLLAPVGSQEIWAAGVTFERSRVARKEESAAADIYDRIYEAQRPELFFKAAGWRVRGPQDDICIRSDSGWDVPEPELALVVNSGGDIVAYSVANDVSSRSLEGANPLYLPQAKVYDGSCAIGPALVSVTDAPSFADLVIQMSITRDGREVYSDSVPLSAMRRRPHELVKWLFDGLSFPAGVFLLTGTSIVPPQDFTLEAEDTVTIAVNGLGTLANRVVALPARHRGSRG